jgi:hypothetical protein
MLGVSDQHLVHHFSVRPFLFVCRNMSLLHGQVSGMGQGTSAFVGCIFYQFLLLNLQER